MKMQKIWIWLLLATAAVAMAGTITIRNPNPTIATVELYWQEGDYTYGPYGIPAFTTKSFEVEDGTYDIHVDNGNGDFYIIDDVQVGDQDSGFYHEVRD
ncbi:MAG: hypothetical protein R6U36_03350 [Candidatus Fermentibacteraceae bacterium]